MGIERINEFKRERKLTNSELASLSGVPKSTIDKITSGQTVDPKLETVKALLKALGKKLKDIDTPDDNLNENFSISAKRLAIMYDNELNSTGQEKLLDYADDLVGNSKYKKGKSASKKDEKTFPAMEIAAELMEHTDQIFRTNKPDK